MVKEPPIGTPERLYTEKEAQEFIDRTPGGVALVSPETITQSLGTNFKDVLDFVPGVFVQPRQGGTSDESQFSIRGSGLRNNFHIRGINILQDGFILNITTPIWTTPWPSRSSTTSTTIGVLNLDT